MKKSLRALATALALLVPAVALADCTISLGSLAFGGYDVFTTLANDSLAQVSYSCSAPAVSPTISISKGNAPTFSPRRLTNGIDALSYNLFLDAARTIVWGDGTGGTSTFAASMGTNLVANIHGRIFARQNLPVGQYTDSLVVTIIF